MVEANTEIGAEICSFSNTKKFWLLVKLHFEDRVRDIFGAQTSTSQPLVDITSEHNWDPSKLPTNKSQLLD